LGQFSPIRKASALGRIAEAVIAGPRTLGAVSATTGIDADKIVAQLKRARVTHGVDYAVNDTGVVRLSWPEGKELFVAKAEMPKTTANASKNRQPRADKLMEQAKLGILPPAPDFTAPTHKPWRKKLTDLQELVASKNLTALREYKINPISTSPKALNKYRNCAVVALEVAAA
jgi:hypothetical protein